MQLDDFLDMFNWIDRFEGLVSRFVHADWRGSLKSHGPLGLAGELGLSTLGANAWTFRVPVEAGWSGGDIERFLKHYGIIIWGRRITGSHTIFSVKRRQARWAEYLLLRRGIPLDGRIYDDHNPGYAQQHAPGDQPPAWADRDREAGHKGAADRLLDWLS